MYINAGNTDDRNRYLQKLSALDKRDSDNDFEDENDVRYVYIRIYVFIHASIYISYIL
jgi:hypothetical protein